jgi:hypothetical protein
VISVGRAREEARIAAVEMRVVNFIVRERLWRVVLWLR